MTSFVDFIREITEKGLKSTKKVETAEKKEFDLLLGGRSTQKLVKIHNRYLNILNLFNISMILLDVLFDDFDYMLLSSLLNCMLRINVHSCSLDNC